MNHGDLCKQTRQQGFTLTELVLVVVILGILAVTTIGLFTARSGYSATLAKDQFISAALLAQQRALGVQSGSNVSLTLSQSANSWTILISQGGFSYDPILIDREGATVTINGSALGNGSSFTLNFNNLAALSSRNTLVFSGDNSYTVCVAQTGFTYEAPCGW